MKVQMNVTVDGDLKEAAQHKLKFMGLSMAEFITECLKTLMEGSSNGSKGQERPDGGNSDGGTSGPPDIRR